MDAEDNIDSNLESDLESDIGRRSETNSTRSETPPPRQRVWRRLRWLLLSGLISIVAAVAYRHYWLARPIGAGPAGPEVAAEPFENGPWTERKILLLGVGDSVTAGLGASRHDLSYFARLTKNPADEFSDMQGKNLAKVLPNLEIKNVAVSGSNSKQHLTKIESLPEQESDVFGLVVMTSGGNDLIHWYGRSPPREAAMYGATLTQAEPWIAAFEARMNKMLDLLESKFPGGCRIFLGDIYDPTDGVGDAPSIRLRHWPDGLKIHRAYNLAIYRCIEQRPNVHLVPMHATFLGHGSHCRQFWRKNYRSEDPHYWYFTNVEDPNDRGYDALRRIFLITIAESMSKEPPPDYEKVKPDSSGPHMEPTPR